MNAERRRKRDRNDPDRVTIGSPTERKVPTTNQSAEGEGDEDTLEVQNAVIAQLHTPSSFYHQFRKAMNSNNQGN